MVWWSVGVPQDQPISDRRALSDATTPAARSPLCPCRQEQLLGLLGAVTKLRRLLANACDELQVRSKMLRTSSWPNLPSVEL